MAKIEELKQLSILGVAESLGMELDRTGSHTYSWKEHDSFVINTRDNYFNWFSRSKGGDVFSMVQLIREEQTGQPISFKEAKHFLEEGNFEAVDLEKEVVREPFSYYLQPYETDFSEARQYLKQERQLSEETIDFFLEKGVLSQATKKSGDIFEPVIVFKSLDRQNEVVGASLQGIKENHELHARGRLKQIMRASDGLTGMHVDIGTPRRLVFAEAPIDLMSYYELHRDTLKDVRLVAMDGLKESTISRHVADLMYEMGELNERVEVKNYPTFLAHTSQMTDVLKQDRFLDIITIAVDNDEAGRNFIERLESKKINLVSDLPPLSEGAEKMDWNDYLKGQKEKMEELKSSYENEPLQERIDNFKAQYAERYPKDITNSFINFIREGVEDDDIQIMHQIIDSYDSFPTANQFEKNLPDLFEEFKEIDKLFTSVNRADIPDNVYSEKEVLELLSKLESNSEEGYIWTDESYFKDNFRNPGFVSKVITQYFEEGDIDRLLNNKSVHLTVGDTTFKIDSVDPSYSIYSIEDLAERISEDLKVNSINTILQKLEELNRDFLDAKDIINSKYHSLIQEYGEPITIAETKKEEYERDSDGDGIPDEIERNMGTNPYSADSDGDGKSDQEEVSFGSNPLKNEIDNSSNSTQISQEKSVSELIKSNDSKGLAKVLKDGVREYFKSDIYINYLIAMSKFHSYSPRNIQLILAQNPNASHVASFKKWKEDFERSVNKGSKALRIFAPVTIKEKDPKTGKILVDKNGKEKTKTYFKLVPVFDVSQTNGKELAKPVYDLEGTYQDYGNLYKAAKEVSEANGVPITFENDLDGAHGTYSRQTNSISILKGMSEQQTLKTLFHEMAHSELHTLDKLLENPLSRSTKELQAESVAFVVSNHYGLDTSEYSFGYLASWAEDKEGLTDLEGQIKIVQKEANNLITKIDSVLEKYQNKEVTKDAFQEKLSQFKSKSPEKGHEIKEKVTVKEPSKKEVKSDNEMSL